MYQQQNSKIISTLDGPLDYSFKNIRSLQELLLQLNQKQSHNNMALLNSNLSLNQTKEEQIKEEQLKKASLASNHNNNNNHQNNNGQDQDMENHANKYDTKLQIVRTIEISETKILESNKNASKKKQKNQKKITKIIDSQSSAIFLRYNKITSVEGISPIIEKIFPNYLSNLIWIDLSHNRLVTLVDQFTQFPQLKNLYLHVNFINDFKEIEKLAAVEKLKSLTIHANPLENYSQFRVLIGTMIPQLQKIDSTLLTKRERDRGQVLRKNMKKYPIIKNPEQRPQDSDNEDDN